MHCTPAAASRPALDVDSTTVHDRRLFFILLAALAVACGTSSTSTPGTTAGPDGDANSAEDGYMATWTGLYDCAWVNGPNCWKSAVASAVGCLPPAGARGVYSADGSTCTYPGGIVITFTPAMVLNGTLSAVPDFTLTNNGAPCLQYARTSDGNTVTMPAGTVGFSGQADAGIITEFSVTCPDHTTYSGPSAPLASCSGNLPYLDEGLGGIAVGDAAPVTTIYTSLNGAGGDAGFVSVFACDTP
jgi:hypothetical protein